jgi:ribosomal protein S18 acetylase RimI-like enzyme
MLALAKKLAELLRHLRPRCATYYVLGQRVPPTPPPAAPDGIRLAWIDGLHDPRLGMLLQVSKLQGMEEQFVRDEIQGDNWPVLAVAHFDGGERPAGAAWLMGGTHSADEALHDLDPGPDGCQLMNCVVLPEFRGRRLQRLLTRARLALAAQRGRRWVYTLIAANNVASLRNTLGEGNRPLLRLDLVRWGGWVLPIIRRLTHRMPTGNLIRRT